MRIRNRSLFPLPPISHSLALLNLPSKNPTLQQLQQKKEATTTTTAAAARGEGSEGRRVQGLHSKGDRAQQGLPKEEEDDRSTTPDVLVTVLKKRNGCISPRSSLPPNPLQTSDGKQVKLEEDEDRLTAIHNHNNSKSWATESAAGHALLLSSASFSSSSSHHHQGGRWFGVGEEASLKKRRAGSEGVDEEEKLTMMKEKKGNMRKRKMSKKNFNGDEDNGEREEEEEEEEKDGTDDTDLMKKKGHGNGSNSSTGGGSVMEGSRCSRVNGRGWRCCQQTLVGYALCEHHLGKGRLRSMISVRSRSSSTGVTALPKCDTNTNDDYMGDDGSLSPLLCKQQENDDEGEEEKLMIMKEKNKNKRKRIGMVKARSISSLLGQTHQAASTTAPTTAIALGSNLSDSTNNLA